MAAHPLLAHLSYQVLWLLCVRPCGMLGLALNRGSHSCFSGAAPPVVWSSGPNKPAPPGLRLSGARCLCLVYVRWHWEPSRQASAALLDEVAWGAQQRCDLGLSDP